MRIRLFSLFSVFTLFIAAVNFKQQPVVASASLDVTTQNTTENISTVAVTSPINEELQKMPDVSVSVPTEPGVNSVAFVAFAKTLLGTPYAYGSMDPAKGFDCSGFVNYVAHHFGIVVPRSSVDFTNVGTEVAIQDAKPGDLILFRGTDLNSPDVGHIGIITNEAGAPVSFIHSSSGKAMGVIESTMSDHYKERFVKLIRIFPGTTSVNS